LKHSSNSKKGVITAFVAVVTPVLILLVLVLSDIYLAKNALVAARNAFKASCGCVLSQYSTYMKEEYSLYGYEMSDEEALFIITESLNKSVIGRGLFKMEIENIEITRNKPLMHYPIVSDQISTLMQDEIFKQILIETNEKIEVFSKIKDVIRTLNAKMQIDELIGGLKNAHISLKETIDEINSSQYYHDLMDMIRTADDIYDDMLVYMHNANEEEADMTNILKKQVLDILKINVDNIIYVLKEYNKKAVNLLNEMIKTYADVHILSDSMKRIVDSIYDCPEHLKTVLKICTDAVYEMEDSFSMSVLEQLKMVLDRNIDCLDLTMNNMLEAVSESDEISIYEIFSNGFGMYCDAIYDPDILDSFFLSVIDDVFKDQRTLLRDTADELLNSIVIDDVQIDAFIKLLSESLEDSYAFNADVTDNTSKSIFVTFSDLSDMLSQIKEDIMVNEYIMLYMSNFTRSDNFDEKNRYLDAEVEYLIFGNRDNEKNVKSCKAFLSALRFACNVIHVYTDLPKRTKAEAAGACLAGSWTFGAAAPIAKNLILCSWAMAESAYDTDILCRGGKCPVIKMDGDWNLDIGLEKGITKTPDWLKIGYDDYLRLLLCTRSNNAKVLRLLDLIALNSPNNMDMSSVCCGIKVNADLKFRGILGMVRNFYVEAEDSY